MFGLVAFVLSWQIFSLIQNDAAIVDIQKIGAALFSIIQDNKFYVNMLSTLKIVLIGVFIASVSGIAIGVLMDLSTMIRNMINPLVEMLRNIPSITLFPILLVIFGIGDSSRIFVIFWTSCPAVILSTIYGLRSIEKSIIEAAQSSGANKLQTMRYIKIPLAMPEILNGIRIGIGSGFVAIVVAEMLGATNGLGYMVMWSTNAFKYGETYAYILIIALTGAAVNWIMSAVIKRYERKIT